MNRTEEENKLKHLFGFHHFHDDQWRVIERVLSGERVLMIERTGFGKSLCYQYPATQFDGLTIIFTPLIALMRDQVKFLKSKNVPTATLNSNQSYEENVEVIDKAARGVFRILYIAPERQENRDWIEAVRLMNLSMVVVDEAHCISVWGHDFRPAYRRIINLVKLLPANFPVLATTATATKRVEEDIKNQIGMNITSVRGNLIRDNFHLRVVKVKSEDEKMIWLGQNITKVDGTGIVYAGTQVNTELYARWFNFLGIDSISYNAGLDAESRKQIETDLVENKYKCVVSTNALGMGIDKPDIRFIVHIQVPQSPIHYYQEIGRAGRDGETAFLILFFNPDKDLDLPKAFIEGARPSTNKYQKVINVLKKERLGLNGITKKVNLKQTHVRVILADLTDQGIINEITDGRSKEYEYRFGAPQLNTEAFELLRKTKLRELDDIVKYIEIKTCRMKYLCEYLGDNFDTDCDKCDNDRKKPVTITQDNEWKKKIEEFKENYFPVLEVETKNSNIINGVAAAYYGFSNVGQIIHRCKYENRGDFPDYLVKLTLRAFRKHFRYEKFDLILYVPSTESGNLVKIFAHKIGTVLGILVSDNLVKIKKTEPQKVFQTSILKKDNVRNAFQFTDAELIRGKSIVLIDDIFDSGATMKEIGKYLTKLGAERIAPLVIAKTVGGDI